MNLEGKDEAATRTLGVRVRLAKFSKKVISSYQK